MIYPMDLLRHTVIVCLSSFCQLISIVSGAQGLYLSLFLLQASTLLITKIQRMNVQRDRKANKTCKIR